MVQRLQYSNIKITKKIMIFAFLILFVGISYGQNSKQLILAKSYKIGTTYYLRFFTSSLSTFDSYLRISEESISEEEISHYIENSTVLNIHYSNELYIYQIIPTKIRTSKFIKGLNFGTKLKNNKSIVTIIKEASDSLIKMDSVGIISEKYEDSQIRFVYDSDLKKKTEKIYDRYYCKCSVNQERDNIDTCVSYDDISDGCEERATLIQSYFERENIILKKAFLWGQLYYKTINDSALFWTHHVGLVAYVINTNNFHIEKMIIDFAFDKKPMTLNHWLDTMTYQKCDYACVNYSYYYCAFASKLYREIGGIDDHLECNCSEFIPERKYPTTQMRINPWEYISNVICMNKHK